MTNFTFLFRECRIQHHFLGNQMPLKRLLVFFFLNDHFRHRYKLYILSPRMVLSRKQGLLKRVSLVR